MIVKCSKCEARFDDEFRDTIICPHDTFAANDGANNFAHHPESYLKPPPTFRRFWREDSQTLSVTALVIWILASTFLSVWIALPFLVVLGGGFAVSVLFIGLAYWAWREHEDDADAALNALAELREDEPLDPPSEIQNPKSKIQNGRS